MFRAGLAAYGNLVADKYAGDTIAFLASDGAAHITGQNTRVDGGMPRSV